MFQCISCSKQAKAEDEEGRGSGTPKRKEAVKSLTSQIKDLVLKISGAKSKANTGSTSDRGKKPLADYETLSEGVQYPYMGGDMTPGRTEPVAAAQDGLGEEDEAREWVAQVEPGVQITFETIPTGGHVLKRIRFNRDMFDRNQAQAWWGDNYDRIMELYNVQSFNQNAISTSQRFEDEQRTHYYQSSASGITLDNIGGGENLNEGGPSNEAARTSNSSIQETEFNNGIDNDSEWVEQDQPGVLITIRVLPNGTKEIHRVNGQIFDEEGAKQWWEENRERIKEDYLAFEYILKFGGIMREEDYPYSSNNGVLLVGYGSNGYAPIRMKEKPYWIIKNSWGENGYYKICKGRNICGVDSMVSTVAAVHTTTQ
ncbi:hypothetical protein SESBI_01653 [Sesbania bispinosa]|nr:hypothetical protein SESBI_01653 [Sesbania bispinosa]